MSDSPPTSTNAKLPKSARIAVVAARFNDVIVDELLRGCLERLAELGVAQSKIDIHRVPGAFELPVAAKILARRNKFSVLICLGAVIRGDTPHFDYVAGECARGIRQVSVRESLPVIFGVLTTNTLEQAQERIGGRHGHAGKRAAEAAIEMIHFVRKVKGK